MDFGGLTMAQAKYKSLRRSRSNRWFAGVCGGVAEFFGINAFWIRLAFFLLLIPGGLPGLVPYIILWMVIPKEGR